MLALLEDIVEEEVDEGIIGDDQGTIEVVRVEVR